ncbi:MAG: hypothetical protein DMG37_13765 [Acidobacteria bacterium]|nr:MAG: hypothetical protein DMG37_13765 [Acidobacteriota bacterium]
MSKSNRSNKDLSREQREELLGALRWIHIVFGIPINGYIYSPFDPIPNYARPTRFVVVPVMVLSGLWMSKGHVVRRLFSKRSA